MSLLSSRASSPVMGVTHGDRDAAWRVNAQQVVSDYNVDNMARGSFSGGQRRGRGGQRFGTRGSTHFRGSRGRGRGRGGASASNGPGPQREDDGTQLAERFEQVKLQDEIDEKMGFARVSEGPMKEGWLVNMHPVCVCSPCSYS